MIYDEILLTDLCNTAFLKADIPFDWEYKMYTRRKYKKNLHVKTRFEITDPIVQVTNKLVEMLIELIQEETPKTAEKVILVPIPYSFTRNGRFRHTTKYQRALKTPLVAESRTESIIVGYPDASGYETIASEKAILSVGVYFDKGTKGSIRNTGFPLTQSKLILREDFGGGGRPLQSVSNSVKMRG